MMISSFAFFTPWFSLILLLFMLACLPFSMNLNSFGNSVSNLFYMDSLSFSLISLSLMVVICMLLTSVLNPPFSLFQQLFVATVNLLLILLVLSFSMNNLFMFYIFFEASIFPTFMLVLGWGNQPERNQASKYLFMYTISASLPLLLSILFLYEQTFSVSYIFPRLIYPLSIFSSLWSFFFLLAFMVKLPLYAVHVWLPKAHVEAPVAGSMALAALLLKLGGYGLIRFSQSTPNLILTINHLFLVWACAGGAMAALLCVFQTDIKVLIALSSVAHMALVAASILTFSNWGLLGAQSIMIGHGFCSSGLFCAANMIYERSNSRNLLLLKSAQTWLPTFTLWWFLLCTTNMASPPSLNLLGEMMSIASVYAWSYSLILLLCLLIFLAAAYSLFLFSSTQHGKFLTFSSFSHPLTLREHLLLISHWVPLNFLFLSATNLFLTF